MWSNAPHCQQVLLTYSRLLVGIFIFLCTFIIKSKAKYTLYPLIIGILILHNLIYYFYIWNENCILNNFFLTKPSHERKIVIFDKKKSNWLIIWWEGAVGSNNVKKVILWSVKILIYIYLINICIEYICTHFFMTCYIYHLSLSTIWENYVGYNFYRYKISIP